MKNNLSQLWHKGIAFRIKKVKLNIFLRKKTNLFLLVPSALLKNTKFFFVKLVIFYFFSSFSNAHTTPLQN
jgi:hypothetical protein